MDEVTQQNAALVEQAAAAASLEQQASELVGAISIFNVAQNGAKQPTTIIQLADKKTAKQTKFNENNNLSAINNNLKQRNKIAVGDKSNNWNEF